MTRLQAQPVIMQVIPVLGPGGAEQGCIDVAAELVASGAQAIVVSNGGSRVRELARIGAMHINLPVDTKNPIAMWRNIGLLKNIIRKHNVNIVHARSRAPAWSAWLAAKRSKSPLPSVTQAPALPEQKDETRMEKRARRTAELGREGAREVHPELERHQRPRRWMTFNMYSASSQAPTRCWRVGDGI